MYLMSHVESRDVYCVQAYMFVTHPHSLCQPTNTSFPVLYRTLLYNSSQHIVFIPGHTLQSFISHLLLLHFLGIFLSMINLFLLLYFFHLSRLCMGCLVSVGMLSIAPCTLNSVFSATSHPLIGNNSTETDQTVNVDHSLI